MICLLPAGLLPMRTAAEDSRIPNPYFETKQAQAYPTGWRPAASPDFPQAASVFSVRRSDRLEMRPGAVPLQTVVNVLGITRGNDAGRGSGGWRCRLPAGKPGREYVFTARLYRDRWENGEYADVRIWGQSFRLDTHLRTRVFQPVRLYVRYPSESAGNPVEETFEWNHHHRGTSFYLAQPRLVEHVPQTSLQTSFRTLPFFSAPDFFPIGVYGAERENLAAIKRLALNTVIIGGRGTPLQKTIEACHAVGLRYVIATPRRPAQLPVFMDTVAAVARPCDMSFYVNDEPGIHSFPPSRAREIRQILRQRFPGVAACMAVVRPQVCRDYQTAADVFMLDQYPVPFMPMRWLSDSMERAAHDVGHARTAAVIQAFGGKKYQPVGWPRLPTWREMDCLSFLSVIHGGRGIFFFTYRIMGQTPEGREALGRVVGRLNQIYPWLTIPNRPIAVPIEMTSENYCDPTGQPAVHACLKHHGNAWLLLAVNTIGTRVAASLGGAPDNASQAVELFSQATYTLREGRIQTAFQPYEAMAFRFR
jgi:hypothetical protein